MTKYVILILIVLSAAWFSQTSGTKTRNTVIPTITNSPTQKLSQKLEVNNQTYSIELWKSNLDANIQLINNLETKYTSEKLMSENKCRAGINGGFYDTNSMPLGKFYTNNKLYKRSIKSNLFNGFLYKTIKGEIVIHDIEPNDGTWILQTGPLLIKNQEVQKLLLSQDSPARRSVAIRTKNEIVMVNYFLENNTLMGPNLADLPLLVRATEKIVGKIDDAINLDGGSAAAFYNEEIQLPEFNAVGSWLCLK